MLLLAGVGALAGCAQMPGGPAYAPVQLDPRLAADRYLAPASDPDGLAQAHTAQAAWSKMENGAPAAYTPAEVAVATREEPVIRTSSLQTSAVQPPAAAPAAPPGAGTRRTLYDKQPWEVELDNMVRGICRGC